MAKVIHVLIGDMLKILPLNEWFSLTKFMLITKITQLPAAKQRLKGMVNDGFLHSRGTKENKQWLLTDSMKLMMIEQANKNKAIRIKIGKESHKKNRIKKVELVTNIKEAFILAIEEDRLRNKKITEDILHSVKFI